MSQTPFWDEERRHVHRLLSDRRKLLDRAFLETYGKAFNEPVSYRWRYVIIALVIAVAVGLVGIR